jgi:hypothetical protein
MSTESRDNIEELKKRYHELVPKVAERKMRRKAQRSRLVAQAVEMLRGIIVQALGTVLGVFLLYIGALAGGLFEGTGSIELRRALLTIISLVLLLLLLIYPIVRWQEYQLTDIEYRLKAEEIRQKVAAGAPLNMNELRLIQAGVVDLPSSAVSKMEQDEDGETAVS